jgi:hypothetical protein
MAEKTAALFKELIGLRGGAFHDYLKTEYRDTLDILIQSDGEFKTKQGEARILKEWLHLIENAKDALIKSERTRPDMRKVF